MRFFFTRANPGGRFTSAAKEMFSPLVKKACQQYIRESVSDRLRSALENEDTRPEIGEASDEQEITEVETDGIITTEEELEGFRIVRAIACQAVPPDRVFHRDTKTYMGVLLDDNNRKPICRLWFNSNQKYVGVFDAEKNETRIPIAELTDIYLLSSSLLESIKGYEQ